MSFFEENNIRCVLKKVFDSYTDVNDLVFTTYDFDPFFFEEHIISFLMGSDKKATTIGELNEINRWIEEHQVVVYYDARALKAGSSSITLPVYPQIIRDGVFHPKVIVIYGKIGHRQSAHLIVSSCNLTVSGFGRNKEAFSCIEVRSKIVADSLLKFLNRICEDEDNGLDADRKRHGELRSYLKKNTSFNSAKNVEFFWNCGSEKNTLEKRLSLLPKGKMCIVSPYFDEDGPAGLLNNINGKEGIEIYPAVDGGNYNITETAYLELKQDGVKFAELSDACIRAKNENGTKKTQNVRFTHAKIISKGRYVCVGSYNFTSAALKGRNAEAALIFRCSEEPRFKKAPISSERFLPDEDDVKNGDEIANGKFSIFVSINVYWENNKVNVYAELPDTNDEYRLSVAGTYYDVRNGYYEIELDDELSRLLIKHKQFSVYQGNTLCFVGLINEVGWIGIRPEIYCDSLDEAMEEWIFHNSKKEKEHVYDMKIFIVEDDEEKLHDVNCDNVIPKVNFFDNYFLVSEAMEAMLRQIESKCVQLKAKPQTSQKSTKYLEWKKESKKAKDELFGILLSKPGSMMRILEFVEKEEKCSDHDLVYLWLVCRYLKEALGKMPKRLENMPVYEKKQKIFAVRLNKVLCRYENCIKRNTTEEYYNWIERELFKDRKVNV